MPLLADPKLDLKSYIYRALDFLKRELTYAGQYPDATGTSDPAGLDPIERARADAGLPISSGPDRPTFILQVPSAPQPEAPSYQQTAPVAPEANPWQQAFERLSASLSATRSSQPQAAYSTPTTGSTAGHGRVRLRRSNKRLLPYRGCRPHPQATPAYSQAPTQAPSYSSEQTQPASDEYLANVSDEVLKSFSTSELRRQALLNV